jgi:hypothetical protein
MSASVDFTEADSANEIATRIVDALNALPMPVPASERPVFEVEADGSTVSQVRPPVTPATIRALVFADLGKYGNVGGT